MDLYIHGVYFAFFSTTSFVLLHVPSSTIQMLKSKVHVCTSKYFFYLLILVVYTHDVCSCLNFDVLGECREGKDWGAALSLYGLSLTSQSHIFLSLPQNTYISSSSPIVSTKVNVYLENNLFRFLRPYNCLKTAYSLKVLENINILW